jgi:hypothetical protein
VLSRLGSAGSVGQDEARKVLSRGATLYRSHKGIGQNALCPVKLRRPVARHLRSDLARVDMPALQYGRS